MEPYWNKRSNASETGQCIVCWKVLIPKTFKENQLKNILTMFISYLRSLGLILRICSCKEAESEKYREFKIWSMHNSCQPGSRVATWKKQKAINNRPDTDQASISWNKWNYVETRIFQAAGHCSVIYQIY